MQQEKKTAIDAIEQKASLVCEVADHIWDYAELSLQEVRSAALYCEVLEKEGFHVEKGMRKEHSHVKTIRMRFKNWIT